MSYGKDRESAGNLSRRKLLQAFGAAGAAMAVGSLGAVAASGKAYPHPDLEPGGTVTKNVYSPGRGHPDHPRFEERDTAPVFDVRRLGAAGDGIADDTAAFEQALLKVKENGRGVVQVPPGQYVITRPLRLWRNTFIRMDDGAVLKKMGDPDTNLKLFVNGEVGNPGYATGYDGDGGITVIGGTIDLCGQTNAPTKPSLNFQAFAIAHADGVHIERVTFINGHNGHIIEFNSSRNVKLLHCLFKDQIVRSTGQYEMVQIDFASKEAFPTFGSFDDTPCRDVVIAGCTFENGHRGVGTHGSKYDTAGYQVFHEGIRIVNNHFKNMADIAIKPESYRNAVISGNTIENSGSAGIALYSCQNTVVSNNTVRESGLHGITVSRKTVSGGFDEPSVHITVSDNIVTNTANSPLRIIGGMEIVLEGNLCSIAGREGVYATNTNDIVVRGNVFRGVAQAQDGGYYGLRADGCAGLEVAGNSVSNSGFPSNYKYAIYIPAGSSGVKVSGNTLASGTAGMIRSDAADSAVEGERGERPLTAALNVSTGTVALNDDITKYKSIIVATGSVSDGNLRHETARGWSSSGFRPGTDFLNVSTANGKLVASIDTSRQLTIVSTSDPLRYVIGIL
ncbi:right-handed parallel beta-helix repeat-containing protein [Paenibacillus ginsengarvi]|uniref:Uncharacterized protein n=1 Tax=Paenibacillus ginsengarvi TaxID=400777 RepID=A0A3B0CEE1_9BACL|nr:right-handed parallel beta-helix repeat-containing protein [Paenibacillus ginsengarvi]RKN83770.1 hypothetical protein D7M11_16370 [Paenibacillus ginsengarvi]